MKNKFLAYIIFLFGLFSCNQTTTSKKDNQSDSLRKLNIENDSLKDVIFKNALKPDSTFAKVDETSDKLRGGKHSITLQWIGWNEPGSVNIEPIGSDWYTINGNQKNKEGDFLKIDGKIKRVSEKELLFIGEIITKVAYINNGQPCIKKGEQTFYAKGSRKYFRLQNMNSCEGGTVDYVDIYAGKSSL